jgi:choline dehydrogenase-like flavoprotein
VFCCARQCGRVLADLDGDVLVVGSGPAGVSAAFPLVESGLSVVLVDGGEQPDLPLPRDEYLALRRHDASQADWMLGRGGHAMRTRPDESPKFRVPTLDFAFRGFVEANRIDAESFKVIGSLAVGGLSNAWGCGVARFETSDWAGIDVDVREWARSFASVARRIGVSGRAQDDLSSFFELDADAQAPLPLDALHQALVRGYDRRRTALNRDGFRLGRARVAVLTEQALDGRQTCDRRGLCLWGCPRESMYSSRQELPALGRHPNFVHRPGHVVQRLVSEPGRGWRAEIARRDGTMTSIACTRVVLAAGTLASTAIAMRSLPGFTVARLMHLPTAAFALWLPRMLGRSVEPGIGFAQLAYTLDGETQSDVCGYTFSTHAIPVAEFIRHTALSRAGAASVFRELLPSIVVANCFMPARLSNTRVRLLDNGVLRVEGKEADELAPFADRVRARLTRAFRRAGALMLPGSFSRGAIGSDVHYAATMPMRNRPSLGEAGVDGEIAGLPAVHVVDGSALPVLPAKSHTLAIMANAHRIGSHLAARLLDA